MAPTDTTEQQLPEPQQGGSYARNRDGSIALREQTQPADGRATRQAAPATDSAAPAFAAAATDSQE